MLLHADWPIAGAGAAAMGILGHLAWRMLVTMVAVQTMEQILRGSGLVLATIASAVVLLYVLPVSLGGLQAALQGFPSLDFARVGKIF